jgi:hypothetical protein
MGLGMSWAKQRKGGLIVQTTQASLGPLVNCKVGRLCENCDETQIVKTPNVNVISAHVIKCRLKDQSFIMLLLNIYFNAKILSLGLKCKKLLAANLFKCIHQ